MTAVMPRTPENEVEPGLKPQYLCGSTLQSTLLLNQNLDTEAGCLQFVA